MMIQTAADLRSFVEHRLREMRSRPGMWAYTKEGFMLQVRLLIEIVLDVNPSRFMQRFCPQGSSATELIDDAWACEVIDAALLMLNEVPER